MAFISRGAANFIKNIYWHNCARPWYVYVETFIPAFLKAAFTIAFLDAEDIMRMHASGLAAGHGSGPRRGKKHFVRMEVAVKETPTQRSYRRVLKTLLIITAPLEAAGFAVLVYHASDRFWFDWSSLIMQSDFCDQPIESGPLQRSRGEGQIGILISGDVVPLPLLEQNRGGWGNNAFHSDLPEGYFKAYFGLSVKGPIGGLNGVFLRFYITTSLGLILRSSDPVNIAHDERVDLILDATFFITVGGGGSIAWEIVGPSVPAGIWCYQGDVSIMRTG